jgi:hypothetical protein
MVIAFLLFASLISFSWIIFKTTPPPAVNYPITIIKPVENEVCLGGVLRFPVTVDVQADELPNQITPAESWCKAGRAGACRAVKPANMDENTQDQPLVKPRHIETVARRAVPATLAPGEYEFWHTTTDAHGNVVGYSVEPIIVKVCQP